MNDKMTTPPGVHDPPPPAHPYRPPSHNDESLMGLMSDLASNTGMHGVPNIQRSKSIFRRLLWLVVVLCGIGMLIWKVQEAFVKYYQYPVETSIEYLSSPRQDFPAVTICNLNPLRLSALDGLLLGNEEETELHKLIKDYQEQETNDPFANRTGPAQDWDQKEASGGSSYYDDMTSDMSFFTTYLSYTARMSASTKYKLGHKLNDMLIECTVLGKRCGPKNFTHFDNHMFGNCYTFNVDNMVSTSKVGPLYGLQLQLYVEQREYVAALSMAAGIRVLIHNQTVMPFPEDHGISVSPGTRTSIGIRKVHFRRAEPPYGPCAFFTAPENRRSNAFVTQLPINYTSTACKKTCFQKSLIRACGCYDSRYPFGRNMTAFSEMESVQNGTFVPCSDPGSKNVSEKCVSTIEAKYENNSLECSDSCPIECETTEYRHTISSAMFPAQNAEDDVLNKFVEHSDALYDLMDEWGDDTRDTFIRDNAVMLDIYFSDLDYEYVKMSPSYLSLGLLSDLGGQAGLWLGLSIIAIFEVVELVMDVSLLIYHKCVRRKQVSDSQSSLKDLHEMDHSATPIGNKYDFRLSMSATSRASPQ